MNNLTEMLEENERLKLGYETRALVRAAEKVRRRDNKAEKMKVTKVEYDTAPHPGVMGLTGKPHGGMELTNETLGALAAQVRAGSGNASGIGFENTARMLLQRDEDNRILRRRIDTLETVSIRQAWQLANAPKQEPPSVEDHRLAARLEGVVADAVRVMGSPEGVGDPYLLCLHAQMADILKVTEQAVKRWGKRKV